MKTNSENINTAALSVVKVVLKNQIVILETLECSAKRNQDRTRDLSLRISKTKQVVNSLPRYFE
jgi:hypothetical protein